VLKPKDEAWLPKIKLLRRIAQQHIEEEEHELFPRLRSIWDEDKSRHIARGMEELKARRRKELEVASPTGSGADAGRFESRRLIHTTNVSRSRKVALAAPIYSARTSYRWQARSAI
jgi:hypothetical protein